MYKLLRLINFLQATLLLQTKNTKKTIKAVKIKTKDSMSESGLKKLKNEMKDQR